MSRTSSFKVSDEDKRRNITIYNLEHAKISLISYNDLKQIKWNDSFDKLAECLENESSWGLY